MERLLEFLDAERGRRIALAHALKISAPAISGWKQVPVDRVWDVSSFTGIPAHELRPDIFREPAQ